MTKTIIVSRTAANRLKDGHPWGFRGEIRSERGDPEAGDVVHVTDERHRHICWAFYSPKPLIALRQLTRDPEPPATDTWAARVKMAAELRRAIITSDTDTFRAVYSDSDGLPGLIVDKYADILVVQTLTQGIERVWEPVRDALIEQWRPRGILARNDQKVREMEGLEQEKAIRWGEVPESVEVFENGIRFVVDPWNGQKTGAYLDQRENRLAARTWAKGRVLDAFTYQGWFALNLASAATEVLALDGSAPACEMVERNAAVNGFTNVRTIRQNAFNWLKQAEVEGQRFDMVLLDPPAFCKNKQSIPDGVRGYKEINLRAMRLLDAGGILMTSSCSYHLSEERFISLLEEAARDTGRTMQILERRTQGRDHPRLLGHPESYYLKTFILRML